MRVNLSNLIHLTLSGTMEIGTTYLLLKILEQAPQLSSLKIEPKNLALLFNNDELRKYLNKMIKKLHLWSESNLNLFINDDVTEAFCKIFSNLEQLSCTMEDSRYLLVLLKRLSKISMLKITFKPDQNSGNLFVSLKRLLNLLLMKSTIEPDYDSVDLSSFEVEARKLNVLFRAKRIYCNNDDNCPAFFKSRYTTVLTIWIGNKLE
jgi:hypothetical protein